MGRGNQGTVAVNRHSLGGQYEFEQAETGKAGGIVLNAFSLPSQAAHSYEC
jgi:hypothetical protein